jgi:hypothetical protein
LNHEAVAAANGFSVKYFPNDQKIERINEKKAKCVNTIEIRNREELKELGGKLLKTLETAAKTKVNPDEELFIKLDLYRITEDFQEISERHLAFCLSKQQIKPTFEYATKTMNKIKKIAK